MTHKGFPLVTVITPTYNRGETYLIETIESVLAQDYPNFEYIILDDGSSDNTQEILESYGDRIIWDYHPNKGLIPTMNKAFRMAKGEYITAVNSDDPILPGLLSKSVEFMEAHPDVLITYPDWVFIDRNSQPIKYVETYDYDYLHMITNHHCIMSAGTFLRKKALELEPGYNPYYTDISDFEYYLRVGLHGEGARIPEQLATHRDHDQRITADRSLKTARQHIKLIEDFYSREDLPDFVRNVKSHAYSASYIKAGDIAFKVNNRVKARQYFLTAIRMYPQILFNLFPKNVYKAIIGAFLPSSLVSLIFTFKQRLRDRGSVS